METKKVIGITLLILFIGSIIVGLPLLQSLAYGVALAYIARPIAYKAKESIGYTASSALTLIVIIMLFVSLGAYSASILVKESQKISKLENKELEETISTAQHFLDDHPDIKKFSTEAYNSAVSSIAGTSEELAQKIYSSVMAVINLIVTVFLSFVFAFYLLKDGRKLKEPILNSIPAKDKDKLNEALENIDRKAEGMFVGSVYTSSFTAVTTGITLFLLNIPYAVFIAILTGIMQFLPLVASQTVLVPLGIALLLFKNYFAGAIVLLLAAFLFFSVDSFIRPWITSGISKTHPALILVAFIGGILAFGPPGFALGPLIIAAFQGVIETYAKA